VPAVAAVFAGAGCGGGVAEEGDLGPARLALAVAGVKRNGEKGKVFGLKE